MQADFPFGAVYTIVCKSGQNALRIQQTNPEKFQNSRIIGAKQNQNDDAQLFQVERVGSGKDNYQIINAISTLVFDQQSKQIHLKIGKQSGDQLFMIQKANVEAFHNYYYIKTSAKGNIALKFQGILRYGDFNPNDDAQLFRFDLAANNNTLKSSSVIINNYSGKALDVPGATLKKEKRLIQWKINKRWNQRWVFVKSGKGVIIQSLYNHFALDIAEGKKTNGAKVIQWDKTGDSNQIWFPQAVGNGLYKFRSAHESSLFLAIKKHEVEDGGQLQVSNEQNPSMYWRIEGMLP